MQELFKKALSSFLTGICVVTYKTKDGYNGLTVNAFSSLSLDPAKILFCIGNQGKCHKEFLQVDQFAISILSSEQKDLACLFASSAKKPMDDRITEVAGLPVIAGTLATIICQKGNCYLEGDHDIIVGDVLEIVLDQDAKTPLLYFRSEIK